MTARASVTTASTRPAGDHTRRRPVRVLAVMVLLSHAGLGTGGAGATAGGEPGPASGDAACGGGGAGGHVEGSPTGGRAGEAVAVLDEGGVAGSRSRLSRSALAATRKLDPDMDRAAISGRSTSPNAGSKTPAAMGSAIAL